MQSPEQGQLDTVAYAAACHTGSCRAVNEDGFGVFEEFSTFLVVDGCGSTPAGGSAATLTVDSFTQVLAGAVGGSPAAADPLVAAVLQANAAVYQRGRTDPEQAGQGAALCAVRVRPGMVRTVHVGDCRVGLFRDGALAWLTEDHTLVAALKQSGAPPEQIERLAETHANVITRAVGVTEALEVDLADHETRPGDLILLCSDGLTRQVPDRLLTALLQAEADHLSERCSVLLEATEAAGGRDNATVVLLSIRS